MMVSCGVKAIELQRGVLLDILQISTGRKEKAFHPVQLER
jgi:hypothetical protein